MNLMNNIDFSRYFTDDSFITNSWFYDICKGTIQSKTNVPEESWNKAVFNHLNGKDNDKNMKKVLIPDIKKVYFNPPYTIVLWSDGTKTMVKCQEGDIYDAHTGLAMAISKKALGNSGNYYNIFKKHLPTNN